MTIKGVSVPNIRQIVKDLIGALRNLHQKMLLNLQTSNSKEEK